MSSHRPLTLAVLTLVTSACALDEQLATVEAAVSIPITESVNRTFAPFAVTAHTGDTVTWQFTSASPGNAVVRRVPLGAGFAFAPYTPAFANELAGPMIQAPSGIFVLGPTGQGMVEQTAACPLAVRIATRLVGGQLQYLCRSAAVTDKGRTMASTWADPNITGVFIRLQWKDLQPTINTWDDSILIRETEAAVAAGKLYSIVIESGRDGQPPWLFAAAPGGAGLPQLQLIWKDDLSVAACNDIAGYADPTTPIYTQLYKNALSHVASVLKQSSARYRNLAYIKPSGANRATGENRLPTRCKLGCAICNNAVWAAAGYKPSKLYAFYRDQIAHIAAEFPSKSMSYMLIQAGFPRVGEHGCYENATGGTTCPPNTPAANQTVPGGTEQTETIINEAVALYPTGAFVVEHQGLDAAPASVNPWVTGIGLQGKPTMFQTSADSQVGTPAALGDSAQNLWDLSTASALEIYEERLWEALGAPLGGAAQPNHTIGDWSLDLHARRRASYPALGDPTPAMYSFVLGAPVPAGGELDSYVDPRVQPLNQAPSCSGGLAPCIFVLP